jgi:hypothetical protein
MECTILNFKRHESGAMLGFCDMQVGGLSIRGCKLFQKDDKVWFAWPSEKRQDRDGKDVFTEIVTATEPVMRHLQAIARPQIRALLGGTHKEDFGSYRSRPDDDIAF